MNLSTSILAGETSEAPHDRCVSGAGCDENFSRWRPSEYRNKRTVSFPHLPSQQVRWMERWKRARCRGRLQRMNRLPPPVFRRGRGCAPRVPWRSPPDERVEKGSVQKCPILNLFGQINQPLPFPSHNRPIRATK